MMNEHVAAPSVQMSIICSIERNKSLRARYLYGLIFTFTNLSAWFLRDYGERALPKLHYIKPCGNDESECFHTRGVLRVSLGCFIFFFFMFLTTTQARKSYEVRNIWHSGWWPLKLVVLTVSLAVPFFLSSDIIRVYGEVARIGAGIFLVLQLISVIQFISWWNDYWMPDEKTKSCSLGLVMSTIFYIASICGIVSMYPMYASGEWRVLNIFFITWTAVLLIVMLVISLHSKVNRGLLSSGIMASYVVFICWSAIRSEPARGKRGNQTEGHGHVDWITVLGFLIAIGAIVMATFSTGIDSRSFQFRKDDVVAEDDIPYGYGFFHLVFSLGAMYFAMLFINWDLKNTTENCAFGAYMKLLIGANLVVGELMDHGNKYRWSMDVGWTSTWVKTVNEWFAATVYLWTLIYPVVRVNKIPGHEEEPELQNDDMA